MTTKNPKQSSRLKSTEVHLLKEQLDKVMVHHDDATDKLLKSLRETLEQADKSHITKSPNQ